MQPFGGRLGDGVKYTALKDDITSCDLLSLQYQLTSVVRVQNMGYWQFLLFYTIDTAATMVKKR